MFICKWAFGLRKYPVYVRDWVTKVMLRELINILQSRTQFLRKLSELVSPKITNFHPFWMKDRKYKSADLLRAIFLNRRKYRYVLCHLPGSCLVFEFR